MDRTVLLVVLVVAALSPAAAGTAPAQPAPALDESASAHGQLALLTLNGTTETGFTNQSLDVAAAVGAQRDLAAARLERHALDARLEATDPETRGRVLGRSISDLERHVDALRADERALRAAHTNGSIGTATFVRRLARLHVRAVAIRDRLDAVGEHASALPGTPYQGRLQSLRAQTVGFDGAVRERAAAAIRGDDRSTRVYVSTTADGLLAATIDDGEYLREAYRADRRAPGPPDVLDLDLAVDRAVSLYPYSAKSFTGLFGGRIYLIDFSISGGSVEAHLDGSTRDVFYEVRRHRLRAGSDAVVGSGNGTRLVVNRTYPGGPLRIATYDTFTGAPARATVRVAGHTLTTGDDGVVWTLAPNRGRFAVTAARPAGNVTVKVRPLQPQPIGE